MRILIIVLLGWGIFFRFANLEHKIYWLDEAFTSLRASGYTEAEVVQHFAQTPVVSVAELQRYQHPDRTRNTIDTLQSLATEDPQHPPLYYTLAQVWFRHFGSSITAARLLPALISLIALPAAYWLCQELFVKTGVFTSVPSWIAIGLFAISPFQVLYAQESRQYSLWSVTTLVTTAALLRAVRLNTNTSWGIYALTLAMNLYTFLLSGIVALAHGIYVLASSKFRLSKIIPYLGASSSGLIAFLPWAWVVKTNLPQIQKVTGWTTSYSKTPVELMQSWVTSLGSVFFNVNLQPLNLSIHLALLILVGYAFYYLCRQTPKSVWLLIVVLTVVPALFLMLPDLISGGIRSTRARYLIPSLVGVMLAITYLLSQKLTHPTAKLRQQLWRLLTVVLISGSIASCLIMAQAQIWWNLDHSKENLEIAQIINQANHPLLVSDATTAALLSLSHLLQPHVKILIRPRCYTCQIPGAVGIDLSPLRDWQHRDIFLFQPYPAKEWLQELATQAYKFEPVRLTGVEAKQPILWSLR